MLCLFGCFGKRYKIDFGGQKDFYEGAKESYRAGERVTFSYRMIATDTSYCFYLDGEPVNPDYDDTKGFVFSFIMPARDVKFTMTSKNTMVVEPNIPDISQNEPLKLRFDSFDGGGFDYTAEAEDDSIVYVKWEKEYDTPRSNFETGSPYSYYIYIFGLKPGETVLTVIGKSPIMNDEIYEYKVTVDENLFVQAELTSESR